MTLSFGVFGAIDAMEAEGADGSGQLDDADGLGPLSLGGPAGAIGRDHGGGYDFRGGGLQPGSLPYGSTDAGGIAGGDAGGEYVVSATCAYALAQSR